MLESETTGDVPLPSVPFLSKYYQGVNSKDTSGLLAISCKQLVNELQYHPVRSLFVYNQSYVDQVHIVAEIDYKQSSTTVDFAARSAAMQFRICDHVNNNTSDIVVVPSCCFEIRPQLEYVQCWLNLFQKALLDHTYRVFHFFGKLCQDQLQSTPYISFKQSDPVAIAQIPSCFKWFYLQCAFDAMVLQQKMIRFHQTQSELMAKSADPSSKATDNTNNNNDNTQDATNTLSSQASAASSYYNPIPSQASAARISAMQLHRNQVAQFEQLKQQMATENPERFRQVQNSLIRDDFIGLSVEAQRKQLKMERSRELNQSAAQAKVSQMLKRGITRKRKVVGIASDAKLVKQLSKKIASAAAPTAAPAGNATNAAPAGNATKTKKHKKNSELQKAG